MPVAGDTKLSNRPFPDRQTRKWHPLVIPGDKPVQILLQASLPDRAVIGPSDSRCHANRTVASCYDTSAGS
jgi:hypothetical protein